MINTLFLTLKLSKLLLLLSSSTCKHTSMASCAILSNFFEKQWTLNYPQYLSRLSRTLFLTTFLEIAVYQFHYTVLRVSIKNSSNKSTKSTFCFIFLFDISKITKLNRKKFEKSHGRYFPGDLVPDQETGRFDKKLGDSRGNRVSVGIQVWCNILIIIIESCNV